MRRCDIEMFFIHAENHCTTTSVSTHRKAVAPDGFEVQGDSYPHPDISSTLHRRG